MDTGVKDLVRPRSRLTVQEGLNHLIDASRAVLSTLAMDRLLDVLTERAVALTRADRGFLLLADPDGELRFRTGKRCDRRPISEAQAKLSRSVTAEVFRTRSPILSSDIEGDEDLRSRRSVMSLGIRTIMCAPLVAKERCLGVLYVDGNRYGGAFDQAGLAVFQALADLASIALENARLYELATTDQKTGLANSGLLRTRLDAALREARARGLAASLILVDLDHFKSINDTWGHPSGDRVLREVATILKGSVRARDLAARFGGEEFALLLGPAEAWEIDALALAERVRQSIAGHPFRSSEGEAIPVTASLGVARFPAPDIEESDDLVAVADRCLYRAKRHGRNRVASDD